MKLSTIVLTAAAVAAAGTTTACNKPATTAAKATEMVSEEEANKAADGAQAAWISMKPSTIEAIYASDVIGFDPVDPTISTDWDHWAKLQEGFAGMKFNGIQVADRHIQRLDADHFIASGTATLTSTDGPTKSATMRFTDVYERQADGRWLIVNEHVSMKPAEKKA